MRPDLANLIEKLPLRKAARVLAILVVAFAAGHLVQTLATPKAKPLTLAATGETQADRAEADISTPVAVVSLAAGNDPLPATEPVAKRVPVLTDAALSPAPVVDPQPVTLADPCPVTLDLMAQPGGMLGLTLIAPCKANERVVLRHAGLAITAHTTATGALFLDLPALSVDGTVDVMLPGGETISASVDVPDLGELRRFAVQWQADDAFQLHAFESTADGDQHRSASDPGQAPMGGVAVAGGYLLQLGDVGTDLPMLAEVYTFPRDQSLVTDVVVEAAVTPATCGRELLAETLSSGVGGVVVTDLSLAMPDCGAVGDFLVLNNLVPDLKIAVAN